MDFLYILISVIFLIIIILIFIYNYLDRQRFRIERQWRFVSSGVDRWVELATEIIGSTRVTGADAVRDTIEAYKSTKKVYLKTQYIDRLLRDIEETFGIKADDLHLSDILKEKLDIELRLHDFCCIFNTVAEKYNKDLERPLIGRMAGLFRFAPYAKLDFYCDLPRLDEKKGYRQV